MMNDMKIILADDSDLILERLKEMLGTLRHVEIVASLKNGNDTLEALRELKPEVAIVDIRMPGLTGLEVLHKTKREGSKTKFIILTFYSSDHYRQLAFQSGADYFFNKADDFDKVLLTVASLAAERGKAQKPESQTRSGKL
jgi:DNA-binding NarL/FixJ family response regulator